MAVTPDLAPGARKRVWILLAVTSVAGALTYWAFGRTEVLVMAGMVLAVLLYLLAGVRLRLSYERAELRPSLEVAMAAVEEVPGYWLIIDDGGTVLHLSAAGEAGLGHPAKVLVGQRLADLVPFSEPAARVELAELLRFAGREEERQCELPLADETGAVRRAGLRTLELPGAARRARLIALAGESLAD